MKILAAANSNKNLDTLTSSLKKLGHEVIGVTNAEQAIKSCGKVCPDFMIIDTAAQPLISVEHVQKLRDESEHVALPVIFLIDSLDENDNYILQKITDGGDDYLTKPLNDTALAAKLVTVQRIAEIQKSLDEATYKIDVLSSKDLLTGINNRSQFDKILKEQLAKAKQQNKPFALLLFDLDKFRDVNENLGRTTGDLLLKEVAQRLQHCLNKKSIARLGEDEFAIILTNSNPDEAVQAAEKIFSVLNQHYHLAGLNLWMSCSMGIACYPTSANSAERLIKCADVAMSHAKHLGRNNYQLYRDEFVTHQKERFLLEHALHFALENNELFMCYQPIFETRTKKIVGMEALMRWENETFGFISPDIFIPIAEQTGLITPIGNWALREVCTQARRWHNAGHKDFKLSVNISPQQLAQPDLANDIRSLLNETKLPAHSLNFELTESMVMTSSTVIEKIVNELSDMKIGLSLDDFGTGYSSLSHLKRLPITALKIDKSFITDVTTSPNDALIVQSIISLGKMLNLNLIAEGIETEEHLDFLIEHGCYEGQGFYLSKPLTKEEMGRVMKHT
jgi:diguanylate cyclase (GGDEF)-like protein